MKMTPEIAREVSKLAETKICIGNAGPFACLCTECSDRHIDVFNTVNEALGAIFNMEVLQYET